MPYHVLIVEDDASLRQLYGLYLERGQFHHSVASSVQEALDILTTEAIDVILVDINLGDDMDGFDLIDIVRSQEQYDKIIIVILTSFPDRFEIPEGTRVDLALNKPVNYNRLMSSIRGLLDDQSH